MVSHVWRVSPVTPVTRAAQTAAIADFRLEISDAPKGSYRNFDTPTNRALFRGGGGRWLVRGPCRSPLLGALVSAGHGGHDRGDFRCLNRILFHESKVTMRTDESAWFSSEDVAVLEGTSERWARRKYTRLAQQMDPAERLWMRYSQAEGARGMGRAEFPFDLLEPATKAKLFNQDSRIQISASGVSEGPDLPTQSVPASNKPEQETTSASAGSSGKQLSVISRQLSVKASPSPRPPWRNRSSTSARPRSSSCRSIPCTWARLWCACPSRSEPGRAPACEPSSR